MNRESRHDKSSSTGKECILKGVGVSRGIAIGPVYLFTRDPLKVERREISGEKVEAELDRFKEAVRLSEHELEKISALTRTKLGEESAQIFDAQLMMMRDVTFIEAIEKHVQNDQVNAGYAVREFFKRSRQRMEASGSEYIRERASDLLDVQDRVVRNLRKGKLLSVIDTDTIVIAHSLSAADIILFSRRNILGCAMDFGGPTSHVSIMARALGVPAVVGMRSAAKQLESGEMVILDGFKGELIVNPTPETLETYRQRKVRYESFVAEQQALRPLPAETEDGELIHLYANLEFKEEIESSIEQGSEGVGLFRTEFLLLQHEQPVQDEDDQFELYKEVVSTVKPGVTTFRVLDLGGDKMLPMAHREHNPFLGWRGIRVLLDRPELLKPQLRALIRASAFGPLRILLPMVAHIEEVRKFRQMMEEVTAELDAEKVDYDAHIPLGIMVEVPGVALMAHQFASEADFFSIGTNDLTQFVLAVDRGNDLVAGIYNEFSPAVLRLIQQTVHAAKAANIPVSVCGEIASKPFGVPILVGLGVRELSAAPFFLPDIKRIIRTMKRIEAEELAEQLLHTEDANTRKHIMAEWMKRHASPYAEFMDPSWYTHSDEQLAS